MLGVVVTPLAILGYVRLHSFSTTLSPSPAILSSQDFLSPLVFSHDPSPPVKNYRFKISGFLPFWQMDAVSSLPYEKLTEIIYFGLEIDSAGKIVTNLPDGTSEMGYHQIKSPAFQKLTALSAQNKVQLGLAFRMMKNETIEKFLDSQGSQKTFLSHLSSFPNLSNLNIDFEYSGEPNYPSLPKKFTAFVKKVQNYCQKANCRVTVDVFADSATKHRLYELKELGETADQIIIMAYDFHRTTSYRAGPVAPLTGAGKYDYDLVSALTDFQKLVPSEKIIVALPLYGYEWPVAKLEPNALTTDKGALATYKRVAKLIKEKNLSPKWDGASQTPWLSYFENGLWKEIYYEDGKSLSLKLAHLERIGVNQIGFWALGYDSTAPEIWQLF